MHCVVRGSIPAVIYGDKKPPVTVSISYNDAMKRIYAGGFLSHVITLDVDGEKHRVIPRDYQLDPVKDFALHVDFLRVGAGTQLNVQVHVHFINEDAQPGPQARRRAEHRAPHGRPDLRLPTRSPKRSPST